MSTVYDESKHPRNPDGKFGTKPAEESTTSLAAPSPVEAAHEQAGRIEMRVDRAVRQIEELTAAIDADSAQQLGHYLRVLHPDATHARLERDEHRWRFDAALDADGNELDIDRGSGEWDECEDAIDVAASQFSNGIAKAPAITLNHHDGEPRFGDGVVVDVRPAQ